MSAADELTDADLARTTDQLIEGWRSQESVRARTANASKLRAVYGIAANAHYVAADAQQLLGQGRLMSAMPLIRLVFEDGVTAQWLVVYAESEKAFSAEYMRSMKQLSQRVTNAGMIFAESFAHLVEEMPEIEKPEGLSMKFEQICRDMSPGADFLYAHYSLLCKTRTRREPVQPYSSISTSGGRW